MGGFKKSIVWVAFAVISGSIGLVFGVAPARASTGSLPSCHSSFDPYQEPASFDESCGDTIVFRTSISGRPDGGVNYNYSTRSRGGTVTVPIPPPGFDPVTASPAERAAYGVPPEPTDISQQAAWANRAKRLHWSPPPPFFAMIPTQAPVAVTHNFYNWAGYAAFNGNFTEAGAGYVEPAIGPSCAGAEEVTWSGIGGDEVDVPTSTFVEQDGTGWGVPDLQAHQAWWEIYPTYNVTPMALITNAGDLVTATTSFDGNVPQTAWGLFTFTVTDQTTGTTETIDATAQNGYSLATAEGVVERPTTLGQVSPLANTGTVDFFPVAANGQPINNFNLDEATMTSVPGQPYVLRAQPSALTSNDSYSVAYVAC